MATATFSHLTAEIETPARQQPKPKTYPNHRAMRRAVAVCTHPVLDGTDMALLHILAENANELGLGARPGNRMLQAACRLSERGVQYRLKKLITHELIERTETPTGGSGRAAVYRICLESPDFLSWEEFNAKLLNKTPQDEVRGSAQNAGTSTPQSILRGSNATTPQPVRETPQSGEETPQPCIATHLKDHLKEQVENKADGSPALFSTKESKEEERYTARASRVPLPLANSSASRAGNAARQRQNLHLSPNLRLSTVVKFFERQYEKRTKVNAMVRDKDLAAIEEMLDELPKVPARRICTWMLEAFNLGEFPFEKGIVSLLNFTKRYRELDLSSSDDYQVMDTRLMGRTWASLTDAEIGECLENLLIIMPRDCNQDGEGRLDGRRVTFMEAFGEERRFFH